MYTADDLARAERQLANAEKRVADQREWIERLGQSNQDTAEAEAVLSQMLELLEGMESHRDTIVAGLAIAARLQSRP